MNWIEWLKERLVYPVTTRKSKQENERCNRTSVQYKAQKEW